MSILDWFSSWYEKYCDGEWEGKNVLDIHTVSNPGWFIKIETVGTQLEEFEFESSLIKKSETDWYVFSFGRGVFEAAGDLTKLKFLLEQFRRTAENLDHKSSHT